MDIEMQSKDINDEINATRELLKEKLVFQDESAHENSASKEDDMTEKLSEDSNTNDKLIAEEEENSNDELIAKENSNDKLIDKENSNDKLITEEENSNDKLITEDENTSDELMTENDDIIDKLVAEDDENTTDGLLTENEDTTKKIDAEDEVTLENLVLEETPKDKSDANLISKNDESLKFSINVSKLKSSKISKIKSSKIMEIVRKEMTKDRDSPKEESSSDSKHVSPSEDETENIAMPVNDCSVVLKRLSGEELRTYNTYQAQRKRGRKSKMDLLSKKLNSDLLSDWNPSKSTRTSRKHTTEYSEATSKAAEKKDAKIRTKPLHSETGVHLATNLDLCDCILEACPGCNMECPVCGSKKCGFECRNGRTWYVKSITKQGTDFKRFHPHYRQKHPQKFSNQKNG